MTENKTASANLNKILLWVVGAMILVTAVLISFCGAWSSSGATR